MQIGKFFLVGILVFLPTLAEAQSLEWVAEHQGAVTPALSEASTSPVTEIKTNDGLEARVRSYFSDAPVMAAIAECESRFRQYNESGKALDGGAGGMIGLFQINASVHASYAKSLGMDIYTVDGNLAYARKLYTEEGTDPWLDSFSCWHKEMQSQVAAVGTNTISHDLVLGSISPEVKALQILLNSHGYVLAREGPGSPGQETEKFGALTRYAVRKFQCEKMQICSGDESGSGYGLVGSNTRDALLSLGGSVATTAQITAPTSEDAQIEALKKQIADLTLQLAALKQKQG
jgi:hypothetical protein